jgi:hypothetical protein
MVSEQLTQERLSTPVAIGVLAPDMISSSAYGTEEMLVVMVPIIGLAAFSMVIPITLAILAVMVFVMISYSQVIGVYTKSGGSSTTRSRSPCRHRRGLRHCRRYFPR